MWWPGPGGPSALEREGGGGGGGDVAGSGGTLRAQLDRWEGGGCGGRVQVDPPRSSGRVVEEEVVTWPGPGGPSALNSTGGRVVDVVAGSRWTLRARAGGWWRRRW